MKTGNYGTGGISRTETSRSRGTNPKVSKAQSENREYVNVCGYTAFIR